MWVALNTLSLGVCHYKYVHPQHCLPANSYFLVLAQQRHFVVNCLVLEVYLLLDQLIYLIPLFELWSFSGFC